MDSTALTDAGTPAQEAQPPATAAPAQEARPPATAAPAAPQTPSATTQMAEAKPAQSAPAQPAVTSAGAVVQDAPATDTAAASVTATRTFTGLPTRPAKTSATVQQPAHAAPPSAAGSIGGTLFALALVLGLIFGLAWLARRMPGIAGMRGNTGLRIVRSLALGTRERLMVVEVGGTQLLLGTGASGTRLLHTLETPLQDDAPAAPTPFAQLLAQRLGKKPA